MHNILSYSLSCDVELQGAERGQQEKLNYLRPELIKICRIMNNKYFILVADCYLYFSCDKYNHTAYTENSLVYKVNTFYLCKHFILLNSISEGLR